MYLIPFYVVEPELAKRETRTITLFEPQDNLPPGTYGMIESYCPDPTCDCRRVMLNVLSKESPRPGYLASISYGFDRDEEMAGPFLDTLNPQSKYAESLLKLVSDWVLSDAQYLRRLERHYRLVKQAAADPSHPAYHEIQQVLAEEAEELSPFGPPRNPIGGHQNGPYERVGRNDPCPCGSGKKYKHCCMRKNRRR